MVDLYNIPGDDGKDFRLRKFIEYQNAVPEIHFRFLGEYVKRHKSSFDDVILISWLLSVTYGEITVLLLMKLIKGGLITNYSQFWAENKKKLYFGSAKKYNKNNDLFPILMKDFEKETKGDYWGFIKRFLSNDPIETYRNIHRAVERVKNVGRFSADLFLETIVYLKDYLGIEVSEPFELDWKNCANLTSGIYNIFYEDEKANQYDKTGFIEEGGEEYLSEKLKIIKGGIAETYPEQDNEVVMFIGKICSFRNLFKNARYAGFHHDRELGVIREYEKSFPEFKTLWDECYQIRKDIFPDRFLGELHGWDGIRSERKKWWLKYGLTGAEKNIDSIPKIERVNFGLFEE